MSEEMSDVAARAIEEAEHEAEELSEHSEEPWFRYVALSTTIIAVLCAISSYFTGAASDRASVERTKEVIRWQTEEGEDTAEAILRAKDEILVALGKAPSAADSLEVDAFEKDRKEDAEEFEHVRGSAMDLYEAHDLMAAGITLFQLSIALGAIAILVRKKKLWLVGLVFGAVACVVTIAGYVWFEQLISELAPLLDVSKRI